MEEKKEVKQPEKRKDAGKNLAIVLIAIALIVVIIFAASTPTKQMENALNGGNYEKVVQMYEETEDEALKEEFNLLVKEKAVAVFNSYNKGLINYEQTKDSLEKIMDTKIGKEEVQKLVKNLGELKASKESYTDGTMLLKSKNYVKAIKKLEEVVDYDLKYEDAQNLILENLKNREVELFKNAEKMIDEKDYSKAIDYLLENDNWDKNGNIEAKITKYQNLHLENVKEEVMKMVEDENFTDAIKTLEENIKYTDEDKTEYLKNIGKTV
jgi:tetratricopeptide (TPR) repeat protein